MSIDEHARRLITLALEEDIGPGDVTAALLPEDQPGSAAVVARESLVVAGTAAFTEVYRQIDPSVIVEVTAADGAAVESGDTVLRVAGPARSLLTGERTALNFLQRLCGVATMARTAATLIADTVAVVVDTRKTTPGWRRLEKAAVRAGGARNHRMGLFDGIMIKDNHIGAAGSIHDAVRRARQINSHFLRVEVECDTLGQVDDALDAGADIILLDNMSLDQMRDAVKRVDGRALIEASGGISFETLRDVADTGVDLISMGALTHSARAVDLGLDWTA